MPFELVLDYKSTAQVDTIQIVFASSAAGADFAGQAGAALYVDGLVLNMPTRIKHVLTPEIKVNLFPNPAQDFLVMEMDRLTPNGKVDIFNTSGKLVKEALVNEKTIRLDISELPPGNYHYLLQDEKGPGMNSGSFVVHQ